MTAHDIGTTPSAIAPVAGVSVIIPCFRAETTIARAVAAAWRETSVRQVIVIDDGSSDGSVAAARATDPRTVVETGPNRGACHARNRGMALATERFALFLDADDWVEPGFIDCLVQAIDTADMAVGGHRHIDAAGRTKEIVAYHGAIDAGTLLSQYLRRSVQTGAILWRRAWLASERWDESLPVYQDIDFVIRMLARHPVVAIARCPTYAIWLEHDGASRISNTLTQPKGEAILRVLRTSWLHQVSACGDVRGIGWRAYGLARRAYANDLVELGDRALELARSAGTTHHRGSLPDRLAATVLGLRRATRLKLQVRALRDRQRSSRAARTS